MASSIDANPASVSKGLWMTTDANTTIGDAIKLEPSSNFVNYFSANSLNIRADGSTSIGTGGTAVFTNSLFTAAKVSADGRDLFRGITDSILQFRVEQNGDVKNATGSYGTISDIRLKKNIETTRNGYLDDICKLRVVKYNWQNHKEGQPKELGLIAQEVEQVFPNLVMDQLSPSADGVNYKMIKGSVIPTMLLKAIQELKAELDSVKAELQTLKGN